MHAISSRYFWKLKGLLPCVLLAGEDAGTGMVATNSAAARTGNVSAGTSIFSMVVLERPLANHYPEIDMVTTPAGEPVAMVHCNNCTNDMNAWTQLLSGFSEMMGVPAGLDAIYPKFYRRALEGDPDCGGAADL